MNLDDWASLSEKQQHESIIGWSKIGWSKCSRWLRYHDMAEEAATALKRELQFNPDVTNVRIGAVDIDVHLPTKRVCELILHVCTLLPESRQLEGLPARYYGFPVEVLNVRERREAFLQTLKTMMKELKGWSEADTLKWGDERPNESLNDSLSGGFFFDVLYDKGPVILALRAIIEKSEKTCSLVGMDFIDLRNSMLSVICDATRKAGAIPLESNPPDKLENFDWESVKIKIKDLIEQASRGDSIKPAQQRPPSPEYPKD